MMLMLMCAMLCSNAAANISIAATSDMAQAASGSVRHLVSGDGRGPAAGLQCGS